MKGIKFVSALSFAALLAACSTANDVASNVTEGVSNVASATTNGVKKVRPPYLTVFQTQ